ncbi:hypothetical protein [Amycolatopsis orientalis]|uniref:hypothetical protein n=1 Tax=Amycolatopsis orientalis TaxID=31958 RepID=UPI0003A5EBC6|nr:hypothetical protein [Amycolatopsis orientalis]
MAWETVGGNGGDFEERETLSTNIGEKFEGTYVRRGNMMPSKFGNGDFCYVDVDLPDGTKATFPAAGILLERIDEAGMVAGDAFRVEFFESESKAGRKYKNVRLQINRGGGQLAPSKPKAASKPQAAKTAPVADDDEPPF